MFHVDSLFYIIQPASLLIDFFSFMCSVVIKILNSANKSIYSARCPLTNHSRFTAHHPHLCGYQTSHRP